VKKNIVMAPNFIALHTTLKDCNYGSCMQDIVD